MAARTKVWWCLAGNVLCLAAVVCASLAVGPESDSSYFRYGPSANLMLMGEKLDTWHRWIMAVVLIGNLRVVERAVNEIGMPFLGFNVYNPDKKEITYFTRNELNF